MGKEDKSSFYRKWNKEIDKLADNKSRYEWDEIEELITDEFENENITSDEFDELMSLDDDPYVVANNDIVYDVRKTNYS